MGTVLVGWRLPAPFGVLLSEAECSGDEGGNEDDEDEDDEQTAQADEHDVKGLQAAWNKGGTGIHVMEEMKNSPRQRRYCKQIF